MGTLKQYVWQEEHKTWKFFAFSPCNLIYYTGAITMVIKHHNTFFFNFYTWYGVLIKQLYFFSTFSFNLPNPRVILSCHWVKS